MKWFGKAIKGFIFLAVFLLLVGILTKAAEAYPAPKITNAEVVSFKFADTSTVKPSMGMDALITGPSPMDIKSFTVTGPSGTIYNILHPYFYMPWGIDYSYYTENVVLSDGDYTFHIVDKTGREASVTKTFTYNPDIPAIDPSTMFPANNSYVGTTTPTLSFSAVQGSFYYKVYIRDYRGRVVLYASHPGRNTSVTVPSGILQPNTPYMWYVRVQDGATGGADPNNKYQSKFKYFFTGTHSTTVQLAHIYIESFTWPGNSGNDFTFGAWNIPIAPWDTSSFTVTGPNSNVYSANLWSPRVDSPILRYGFIYSSSPSFFIPNGTYTFNLTDSSGTTATATKNFAYISTSAVSESSRQPADDAYFDTSTPTFSWSPMNGYPNLKYRLRVFGYNRNIIIYTSPLISSDSTSVTLPASLHLPYGSYKWIVYTINYSDNSMNAASTGFRTFTINPAAADLSIPNSSAAPSSTVSIPINVNQANGIAGFQLTVTFDSSVLKATGASAGNLDSGWLITPNTNTAGQITIGGFSSNLTPLSSGSGSIVKIEFKVVGSNGDSTNLTFTNSKLTDKTAAVIPSQTQTGTFKVADMLGDINGDGTVDISDVILCLRQAVGLDTPNPSVADMNGDGIVDISDVILILRKAIGLS